MSAPAPAWPRVLILPGLYDSDASHWQSRWQQKFPSFRRVVQCEWQSPVADEWIATLDAAIHEQREPALLVAHSAACGLIGHWAARHAGPVAGALLVAPADSEAPGFPPEPRGFQPMPTQQLPFRSIVVASSDDPYVTAERARMFAGHWGSRLVEAGALGHVNGASGLDDWPAGLMLLRELAQEP